MKTIHIKSRVFRYGRYTVFFILWLAGFFTNTGYSQSGVVTSDKTEHLLNPFLLHYEGFSNLMGVIYLGKNTFFRKGDIFFLQSVVDHRITIAGIKNFTVPLLNSSVYTAFFYGDNIHTPQTLSRGMGTEGDLYYFNSDVKGWLIGMIGSLTNEKVFTGNLMYANINEKISRIKDSAFRLIYKPKTNIGFLGSNFYSAMFRLNLTNKNDYKRAGLIFGFNYFGIYPKQTFSAVNTKETFMTFFVPLGDFTLTGHFFSSGSNTAGTRSGGTDALRSTYMNECLNSDSYYSNAQKQTECQKFVRKFTDYLTAINDKGLSSPLGGPNKLRSENFIRYQGSTTLYHGYELRYRSMALRKGTLEPAIFSEWGKTYDDDTNKAGKKFLHSVGIGIRLIFPEGVYRLDYATSENGSGIYLTLGHPW